uniref:Uncharacterized protein n=1 Tax=Amazona collaria TaxID=241587 RepID=A0A8B9FH81_9PSIT
CCVCICMCVHVYVRRHPCMICRGISTEEPSSPERGTTPRAGPSVLSGGSSIVWKTTSSCKW